MGFRLLVELMFNAVGFFNIRAWFQPTNPAQPRIAFQTYSIHLAAFYAPVIEAMQDEGVDIHFIALMHPQSPLGSNSRLKDYAHVALGLPRDRIRSYWQCLWEPYSLIIYNDFYARFPCRRSARWLISHGTGVLERSIRKSPFRKTIVDFDRVLVAGERDVETHERSIPQNGPRPDIVALGLPHLDRLFDHDATGEKYLSGLGLNPHLRTVLLAPHWVGNSKHKELLERCFEACYRFTSQSGINLLVKPHFVSLGMARACSPDWKALVAGKALCAVDSDPDDVPALRHADILLTDTSSRAFNFMRLGKPVVLIERAHISDPYLLETVERLAGASLKAACPDELPQKVERYLQNPDLHAAERRRLTDGAFANPGKATHVLAGMVRGFLGSGSQPPK